MATRFYEPPGDEVFDCQRCGACCRNPLSNRREGVHVWVEVEPDEVLLRRPRWAKWLRRDRDGVVHLRLVDDGRCVALRGRIGESVRCEIYEVRPRPCRRVEAGSDECRELRREAGLAG